MNGKWSTENFNKYHSDNPHIYEMFVHFAKQAVKLREKYSAKIIFHRLRWETMISGGTDHKIDDGWISHYARKFIEDYPEHEGFFEMRYRKESYHKQPKEEFKQEGDM